MKYRKQSGTLWKHQKLLASSVGRPRDILWNLQCLMNMLTAQVGIISKASQQVLCNFGEKSKRKNWGKMKTLYPNFENGISKL